METIKRLFIVLVVVLNPVKICFHFFSFFCAFHAVFQDKGIPGKGMNYYLYINNQCMSVFFLFLELIAYIRKNLSPAKFRTWDLPHPRPGRYLYATMICCLPYGLKNR